MLLVVPSNGDFRQQTEPANSADRPTSPATEQDTFVKNISAQSFNV